MRLGSAIAAGVAAAILAVAVGAWTLLLRGGISARREPGALEARVARTLRTWAIPTEAREARSPFPTSPRTVALGLAHFADHCASCHANDGSGDTELARGLYPRPPDLRKTQTQGLTDGELFYIIENGVRFTGMPGWGGASGGEEGSWYLVHFIRHLPLLTDAERAEMEGLNPRSATEWRAQQEEDSFLRGETPAPEPEPGGHAHH